MVGWGERMRSLGTNQILLKYNIATCYFICFIQSETVCRQAIFCISLHAISYIRVIRVHMIAHCIKHTTWWTSTQVGILVISIVTDNRPIGRLVYIAIQCLEGAIHCCYWTAFLSDKIPVSLACMTCKTEVLQPCGTSRGPIGLTG